MRSGAGRHTHGSQERQAQKGLNQTPAGKKGAAAKSAGRKGGGGQRCDSRTPLGSIAQHARRHWRRNRVLQLGAGWDGGQSSEWEHQTKTKNSRMCRGLGAWGHTGRDRRVRRQPGAAMYHMVKNKRIRSEGTVCAGWCTVVGLRQCRGQARCRNWNRQRGTGGGKNNNNGASELCAGSVKSEKRARGQAPALLQVAGTCGEQGKGTAQVATFEKQALQHARAVPAQYHL